MPGIRGLRNPIPSKGKAPTGIFSTRGKQKQDGADGPNMGTLKYAHSNNRSQPTSSSGQGLRHQAPAGGKSSSHSMKGY